MSIKKIVEIANEHGQSFKVEVVVNPFSAGTWRTLDKGFIAYNNGTTGYHHSHGTLTGRHVVLQEINTGTWGIRLNDYMDILTISKQGSGIIVDAWAVNIKPGRISWVLVG